LCFVPEIDAVSDEMKLASLAEARDVLKQARTAALSVLDFDTGGPLGALVNIAVDDAFRPVILTSTLSRHTQCLDRDGRGSVMVTGALPQDGDALTGFRTCVTGRFARTEDTGVQALYLRHHPYAELYAGFGDFGFWIMEPDKLYVVAGFGRVFNYEARALVA
jgi:putative heme iron utilization protein